MRSVLHDKADTTTRLWLILANKTEQDILCREEIDRLVQSHAGRFHVHYTLSSSSPVNWLYGEGRITEAMLRERLPPPGEGRLILACGPQSMIEVAVKSGLEKCGWDVQRDLVVF